MFAFVPAGLASWELIAFSGLLALSALGIATVIGVTVAYLAMREPRAVRHATPARVAQARPQSAGKLPAIPNAAGAIG
jgi:hypothetical protein